METVRNVKRSGERHNRKDKVLEGQWGGGDLRDKKSLIVNGANKCRCPAGDLSRELTGMKKWGIDRKMGHSSIGRGGGEGLGIISGGGIDKKEQSRVARLKNHSYHGSKIQERNITRAKGKAAETSSQEGKKEGLLGRDVIASSSLSGEAEGPTLSTGRR